MEKGVIIDAVVKILDTNEASHYSDDALYYHVCKYLNKEIDKLTVSDFFKYRKVNGMPSYGTVSRIKRKLLPGNKKGKVI